MEIKKILWPTDFSSNAAKALQQVLSLTEKYQAEIHVLYVIEDLANHPDWYGAFDATHVEKISEFSEKSAHKRLDQICEKYLNGCPMYKRHVAIGDPAGEILKLIKKEQMDMVVMATRGAKGQFPFGSVTEKVVKHSPVPVLTIPKKGEEA
jgi:nucleotide-binding universal stress UspA family protein